MLKQLDLYINRTDLSDIWSDLAVKVHGFIMSIIPGDLAEELHNGGIQPFSIFCVYGEEYGIIRVSVLTEKAKIILEALSKRKRIRVFGTERNLEIIKAEMSPDLDFSDLSSSLTANKYRLSFVSPAMYKSKGRLHCTPELPSYFESVIRKIECFEGISITREQVNSAFEQLSIDSYSLESSVFLTGGRKFKGMTGAASVTLSNKGEEAALLRTLLAYATFSGIGGMTTQGMGGITLLAKK